MRRGEVGAWPLTLVLIESMYVCVWQAPQGEGGVPGMAPSVYVPLSLTQLARLAGLAWRVPVVCRACPSPQVLGLLPPALVPLAGGSAEYQGLPGISLLPGRE